MIIEGDCIEQLKKLDENSVDSVVTDPPYGLEFMGKKWDYDVPSVEMWKEAFRVLKPGGYLLSFAGTRTQHRMAVNIEDAGFEIRDMILWLYGSGFPKSTNIFKQLQKQCTCGNMGVYEKKTIQSQPKTEHEVRSMQEADISQTKSLDKEQGQVLQSGVSEQGIPSEGRLPEQAPISDRKGQPSVEGRSITKKNSRELSGDNLSEVSKEVSGNGEKRRVHNATQASDGSTSGEATNENGSSASHRSQSEEQRDREPCAFCKQYGTQALGAFGFGSALKPSCEPITVARKPLSEKNLALNYLKHGTGGINIDGCRVGTEESLQGSSTGRPDIKGGNYNSYKGNKGDELGYYEQHQKGRFPANLIHDGSDEVVGLLKESARFFYCAKASKKDRNEGLEGFEEKQTTGGGGMNNTEDDVCGKYGSIKAKAQNNHPTVKPTELMRYLVRLVTPPKGVVLDPFMGSGSTGKACKLEGFEFIGIELDPEYIKIAEARIKGTKVDNKQTLL